MNVSRPKLRFLTIFLVGFTLLLFNQTASASTYLQCDTVQSSETISNDIFLSGEDIHVDGIVEGDVFAVGNNITIDGTVEGSLFAIGQNVAINGQVDGSVYTAGVTFNLGEEAEIGHSLYFVGVHLGLKNGSSIGWDLNGFLLSARITTWGIGFSSIGLGFSLFVALIAYISKIIVASVAAKIIFEKILPSAANRRVWPLLIGTLLFVLIRAIPYFGWVAGLIVTWTGMGAVWMAYKARGNESETVTAVIE